MDFLLPEIAVAEKILRSVIVYGFLLVAFRMAGKRLLGQLTAFDLVVLLIISNVLQNSAIGPDNSLGGGLLGAAVIIGLNFLVANGSQAVAAFVAGYAVTRMGYGPVLETAAGVVLTAALLFRLLLGRHTASIVSSTSA